MAPPLLIQDTPPVPSPDSENNQIAALLTFTLPSPSDINEPRTTFERPHLTMKENGPGYKGKTAAAVAAAAACFHDPVRPAPGSSRSRGLFVPPNYFNPGWYHLAQQPGSPPNRRRPRRALRDTIQISSMRLSDDPRKRVPN